MEAQTPVDALHEAIRKFGSQAAFAAELSRHTVEPVSQARVWNWLNRDSRIPAEICPLIEELTGVRCEALSPGTRWHVLRAASGINPGGEEVAHG